jgi:hypothetical protein
MDHPSSISISISIKKSKMINTVHSAPRGVFVLGAAREKKKKTWKRTFKRDPKESPPPQQRYEMIMQQVFTKSKVKEARVYKHPESTKFEETRHSCRPFMVQHTHARIFAHRNFHGNFAHCLLPYWCTDATKATAGRRRPRGGSPRWRRARRRARG